MDLRVVFQRLSAAYPRSGSSPGASASDFHRTDPVRTAFPFGRAGGERIRCSRLVHGRFPVPRIDAASAWSHRKLRPPRRCSDPGWPGSPGHFPVYCRRERAETWCWDSIFCSLGHKIDQNLSGSHRGGTDADHVGAVLHGVFARVTESLQYWIIYLASWYRDLPASVRISPRWVRTKSCEFRLSSSRLICLITAGGEIYSFSAALLKLPASATQKRFPVGGCT